MTVPVARVRLCPSIVLTLPGFKSRRRSDVTIEAFIKSVPPKSVRVDLDRSVNKASEYSSE